MFVYYLIYVPFILSSFLDFKEEVTVTTKKRVLWFIVIIFTLFRGLRWEVGTDWDQFYEVYQQSSWSNIFSYARDNWSDKVMDYGYMFINALFHTIGFPYTIFLLVTNFIILCCYKDFCERHTSYPLLTMIMLLNVGVPFPVRQHIAMAISLWAFRFAVEKKWIKYGIAALIAALIHKGSIISVLIVFVPWIVTKYNIKWWWYAIAYFSTYILSNVLGDYIRIIVSFISDFDGQLQVYSEAYMGLEESTSVDFGEFNQGLMNGLSYTIFFSILLYLKERYYSICNANIKSFELFFFLYAIAACWDNLSRQSVASGMTEIVGRVTTTIDMFPLLFPLIFTLFLNKILGKRLLVFLIFALYMGYKYWQQIPGSFYNSLYIPYKSIL